MQNLILPICGASTRFPDCPPKWSMMGRNGKTMLENSLSGLNLDDFNDIIIVQLAKDAEYPTISQNHKTVMVNQNSTQHQPESVLMGLDFDGPFVVKDCDNQFICKHVPGNFVAYHYLNGEIHNAENKSYVEYNEYGHITNIVEKEVISNTFSCGMYGFESVELFKYYYERVYNNMYLSDIIFEMILDNNIVKGIESKDYIDWGTLQDWRRYNE